MCDRPDFTEVVLGPDDFLLLIPRPTLPPPYLESALKGLPDRLHGRVVVVNPDSFDIQVVRDGR